MRWSRSLIAVVALTAVAAASAAFAFALPSAHSRTSTTTVGYPGMIGGYGGMMGGYGYNAAPAAKTPSANTLETVRAQVERWLDGRGFTGFHVAEVMAFSNNDYVAVQDAKGQPAFELLTTPNLSWLMEEPASMMWNTRYGMMRGYGRSWSGVGSMMGGGMMGGGWNGWYGNGHGRVASVAQAISIADRWLAATGSGQRVDPDVGGMGHFPGYYTLDTVRNGKIVGMLSVNAATGAVWYHGWHGRFLAEREF